MAYYRGTTLNIKLTITDPTDSTILVDPTTVTVVLEAPDGTTSVPLVTRSSQGIYRFTFVAPQVGMWTWVVTTTGTYAGVQPGVINVQNLPVGL